MNARPDAGSCGPAFEALEKRLLLSSGYISDPVIVEMSGNMRVAEGQDASFYAIATDADGHAITYTWYFGDGSDPAVGDQVTHAYADNGAYSVLLRVTDTGGGVDIGRLTVYVDNVAPTVDLGGDLAVDEWQSLSFAAAVADPGLADTHTYLWDFGDGTTSTDLAPVHQYTDDGAYTVTLTVTDDDGGIGTGALTVTVHNVAPSIVDVTGDDEANEGSAASFSASATDVGGGALTYSWDFGDASDPAAGQSASHVYADDGVYTVTLTVTDEDGATDSRELTIAVHNVAPSIIDLTGDEEVDEGAAASFAASATDPGSDALAYTWNFGDGSDLATGASASHVYAASGTYTVTLTVSDGDGGAAQKAMTVVVKDTKVVEPLEFSHRHPAVFTRADGSKVIVSLHGPGSGKLYQADGSTFDISRIVLEGTSRRSQLRIRVVCGGGAGQPGDVVVGDIEADGSMRSIVGRHVDLQGDLAVEGWVGKIVLDDLMGASITIGASRCAVRLCFDRVADSSVDSAAPIWRVKATEWLDTDGVADEIRAPSVGRLRTTGCGGRGIGGDFEADLELTGRGRCGFRALGWARIAGDLNGSTWDVLGSAGTVRVEGAAVGSTVRATGSIGHIRLGAAVGSDFLAGIAPEAGRHAASAEDFVNPWARIKSIRITGLDGAGPAGDRYLVDSNFSAARIGCVRLKNMAAANGGRDFGLFVRDAKRSREIQKVRHEDTATGERWQWRWRRSSGSGEVLRKGDFVVNIL